MNRDIVGQTSLGVDAYERALIRRALAVREMERCRAGRRCTACEHPQADAISQALISGGLTVREVAALYGLSKSAVGRHWRHVRFAFAALWAEPDDQAEVPAPVTPTQQTTAPAPEFDWWSALADAG